MIFVLEISYKQVIELFGQDLNPDAQSLVQSRLISLHAEDRAPTCFVLDPLPMDRI